MAISPDKFREVLRQWTSGVTVVTTQRRGGIHGMTASSFCSVSLSPPLVLVCVDRRTRTHEHLQDQDSFAVHILMEGQQELSQRCAGVYGETGNQLRGVPHRNGKTGAPILEQCLAYVDCRLVFSYDGGDHTIFVGEIQDAGVNEEAQPLVYFRGGYRALADA